MAGRMINGAAALAELVRPAGGADELGAHRMVPVLPELSGLLPGRGLRRGTTVAVAGGRAATAGGGTSLLLALLAGASRAGSWCAVVGVPTLGVLAAAESGIALDRLALVPNPGPEWPTVVAALIDGVDVVVTAVPGPVSGSIAGRLAARARQRGCVLMPFGRWDGADVTLRVVRGMWEGLGAGHGRLRRREVTVAARGRGAAARPRELTFWMPGITTTSVPEPAAGRPAADLLAAEQSTYPPLTSVRSPEPATPAASARSGGTPPPASSPEGPAAVRAGGEMATAEMAAGIVSAHSADAGVGQPSGPVSVAHPADAGAGPVAGLVSVAHPAAEGVGPADAGPADAGPAAGTRPRRLVSVDPPAAAEPGDGGGDLASVDPAPGAGRAAGGRSGRRPRRRGGALYSVGPA